MKSLLIKIDAFLLPKTETMHFAPYIWLVYLLIFFTSLSTYRTFENSYWYASMGTIFFLFLYFNSYWISSKRLMWNILAICIVGSLLALITPGASVFFVYAGAFCCRLGSTRKAFIGLFFITVWISIFAWYVQHSLFFYIPALAFTWMIGGVNIYQHDIELKRKELVLSQQEVRHLARTSERERIARDLHDLIGHTFSVITLKAELASKLMDKDFNKAKQEIFEIENISRTALKQIREVVTGYRTSDLNTELAHAKHVLESNEIHFEYQFENFKMSELINKELAIILKELVTNILKHSEASNVSAEIKSEKSHIILRVSDNGNGFSQKITKGFGLKGIKERVDQLSGQVKIESKTNSASGSKFTIIVPVEKHL